MGAAPATDALVAMLIASALTAALQALGVLDDGIPAIDGLLTFSVTHQGLADAGVDISVTTSAAAFAGVAPASGSLGPTPDALGVLEVNLVFLMLAECLTPVVLRAWNAPRGRLVPRC